MKMILFYLLSLRAIVCAEIYDCFSFFNELELLKIRFEELSPVVDHFVLVEATKTFCGDPKPLYFKENINKFEKYKNKVIHIIVDDFPQPTADPAQDRWTREKVQRNAIMKGLANCKEDDIILISDVDEIPNQHAIIEIKEFYRTKKTYFPDYANICMLNMRLCLFFLNEISSYVWEGGSKAALFSTVKKLSPWEIKIFHHKHKNLPKINQAGWHFHSMGGYESILEKLKAIYSYDKESFIDPGLIKMISPEIAAIQKELPNQKWPKSSEISENPDFFKKWSEAIFGVEIVPIDDSYPRYILDHLDYYYFIGWLAE